MKTMLRSFTFLLVGGLLATFGASLAAAPMPMVPHGSAAAAAKYVPGEVLVKLKRGTSTQAGQATVAALGHITLASLPNNVLHVKIANGQTVAAAVAAYTGAPNVQYAQPNYIYHKTATPAAAQFGQQWAFNNTGQTIAPPAAYVQGGGWVYPTNNPGTAGNDMHIQPAWGIITDCSKVVVAVVDTGVNYNQQDLAANMWVNATYPNHGYNFTTEGAANDPMDYDGHGTHVAGIIGAAGNVTTGVCWKASIMAVRVLDSTGSGTTATITTGLNWAVSNGAKVVNMSLGGGTLDPLFSDAVTNAQTNDAVVVVAAGNSASDNNLTPTYPCNFSQPNLICVAALDQAYQLATFSNWGATSVAVGAPGTNILSTFAGTSTLTSDPFTAGWTKTSTTLTGGWVSTTYPTVSGGTVPVLLDPGTWPTGLYTASTTDSAYKTFNVAGNNVVVVNYDFYSNLSVGSTLTIAYSPSGPSAFTAPTYNLPGTGAGSDAVATPPSASVFSAYSVNISNCATATCAIGFRLAASTIPDYGVAIGYFGLQTLSWNNNSYNTLNGTSMASPMVAGLAAMLRAYNPGYSFADVVGSIKNAGRSTASLAGVTSTGKAVDATASLAYINPPSGLSATVK